VTEQNGTDENKKVIRKDTWLACSMLVVYLICCILFVSGSFIWVRADKNAANTNATATEAAAATQQAYVMSTAVAHVTEQAEYEVLDRFDDNSGRWYTGTESGDYGDYSAYIINGTYTWSISDAKGYTQGSDYFKGNNFKDFDAYMDVKFGENTEGSACSGLVFRKSTMGWEDGAYLFSICNDSHYEVYYYQLEEWDEITTSWAQEVIASVDWNRIEVHAVGDHFTFHINNVMVFEMTDSRRQTGRLGIYIEVEDATPALLWIDNFAIQRR